MSILFTRRRVPCTYKNKNEIHWKKKNKRGSQTFVVLIKMFNFQFKTNWEEVVATLQQIQ